jgi:DNA-binding NtrC family response regulator
MHTELKILLAKKDDTLRADYAAYLETLGYVVEQARDGEEIQAICHQMKFDVILLDDHLAGSGNGFHAVSEMNPDNNGPGMIAFIEDMDKFDASKAVAAGISDWVSDRGDHDEFRARLERTIRDLARRQALVQKQRESEKIKMEMEYVLQGLKEIVRGQKGFILPDRVKKREDFPAIIGNSREIEKVLELVRLVAQTNATVLITGESGTGKELITRAIHSQSPRTDHPFVPINCAALSETLLESELFGHEKGAFTGAVASKQGLIAESEGGTLFLDEISEMPLSFQVKLLRVLQYGEYKRVGQSRIQTADIRIVAATNRSLEKMVKDGSFREDLFHRINQFQINVPPLRQRIEDLPMLNQYFLERACREYDRPLVGFSSKLIEKMYRYAWPGNIRELESMVSQSVILAKPPIIELIDMPTLVEKLHKNPRKTRLTDMTYVEAKEAFEKNYFQNVMDRAEGNLSAASRLCRMDRKQLREKVRKLNIVMSGHSGRFSDPKKKA